ncbi:MAG: glycoside hydrolase family 127 protein [Bacteroidales bacterium]|nr:glycoside hydrolase family 127 protein [Bacteroidales bacterium]
MKPNLLIAGFVLLCGAAFLTGCSDSKNYKKIRKVESVQVETPEGTAPRLPYLVSVTYADGSKEWRQVKWMNSARETEEQEAGMAVGSEYTVRGYIIGDSTEAEGYPLDAQVKVVGTAWEVPASVPQAQPLPLGSVRLIGDNRLTSNRDLDIQNLLSLDITQELYNYRDTYGLSTDGYTRSNGWDSPTTKLKGHGSGHYMSALAFAYAGTDDPALKAALKANIKRMVDELRYCQELTFVRDPALGRYREARDLAPEDELMGMKGTWEAFDVYKKDCTKYGYGYINAIPAQHPVLIEKYAPYNNQDWVWAPYYTIHKQLAGLIDIACNVDDQEIASKALLIAKDMGLWVWNRLYYRTYVQTEGTQEERRARPGNRYEMWNMYIAGEVGGMQEALSRLSVMASDPTEKERLAQAAGFFDAPAFYQPLSRNIDDIRTRHANQHIPMIVGSLKQFQATGNEFYYNIAVNFWNLVQGRYAYAMGGVGNGEMFRQPYTQMLSLNTNAQTRRNGETSPDPNINETCCSYNLAKLTKDLNCYNPDDARYMDYYERVLYNQLVGSVHPEHYGVTYQYAVGLNAAKPFGNRTPQSTCCGGTGAENHVKYQEAAYFVSDNTLWVGLYLPTEANWEEKGVRLRQECAWPAESSVITIEEGGRFAMKLRVPYWATKEFKIKLNGKKVGRKYQPSSYVEIPEREWKAGDRVEIEMPFGTHIFYGPDRMEVAATAEGGPSTQFEPMWEGALMYGPLVMASPDITTWEEAEISLDAEEIEAGFDGNVHKLTFEGKTFYPDYYMTGRGTHYLRLNAKQSDGFNL